MIDFQKELKKFKPIMPLGDVEEAIQKDDMTDVKEVLEALTKKLEK